MPSVFIVGLVAACSAAAPRADAAHASQPTTAPAARRATTADAPDDNTAEALERWLRPPVADQPQPKLGCAEPIVDAGDIWPDQHGTGRARVRWIVANEGTGPLRLKIWNSCAASAHGSWYRTVAPGESTKIEAVVWCPWRGPDIRTGHVRVRTNDGGCPELPLAVRYNGRVALEVRTQRPEASFPRFPRTSGGENVLLPLVRGDGCAIRPKVIAVGFDVGSARVPPVDPTASVRGVLTALGDRLSPTNVGNFATEVREVVPGERYELVVRARPPWPLRPKLFAIRLATGVPEQPEMKLSGVLDVEPRLTTTGPLSIAEMRTAAGSRVKFVWSGDRPAGRIVRATATHAAVAVELVEEDGEQVLIGRGVPERDWPCVMVYTDDEEVQELQVPLGR